MFQVSQKIKRCWYALLKWNSQQESNSALRIQQLQEIMSQLQEDGGQRDWEQWHRLKEQLGDAYRDEELF